MMMSKNRGNIIQFIRVVILVILVIVVFADVDVMVVISFVCDDV